MSSPVVQIKDIHKIYESGEVPVHAVRGVSLDIHRGEFIALMGASGSGKSTLMNMLGCLDRQTKGTYLLDGIDIDKLDRNELADLRNQKLGFVFQGQRRAHRNAMRQGELVHRAGHHIHAPALGARRLGVNGGDVMALRQQFGQRRHREIRGAHEREAESHDQPSCFDGLSMRVLILSSP